MILLFLLFLVVNCVLQIACCSSNSLSSGVVDWKISSSFLEKMSGKTELNQFPAFLYQLIDQKLIPVFCSISAMGH